MKHSRLPLALLALAAIGLSACSSTPAVPDDPSGSATGTEPPAAESSFPVTLDVPGSPEPLVIDEEPDRIVALSPDAAIALHELGLTDRVVAVPEVALNKTLNAYAEDMSAVPHTIAGETSPEPEQVLSWDPDLVLVTTRHTGEQDASSRLTATGVPVLSLTNGWSSSEAIAENLELIGEATGATARAGELADKIRSGIADVRERAAGAESTPTVAILSNQARSPFINAGASLVDEIVENGGGSNAAERVGIEKTMPIQPEQLVAARPDYIMLVDVTGKGEESFAGLLGNPAVAELPAVAEGRVRVFPGREVYGLAGPEVVAGSESVLDWLHPELAG